MSKHKPHATRRAFLRGAGHIAIGLPLAHFLSELGGGNAIFAQEAAPSTLPRLITFYFPNGCDGKFWNYDLALSPLTPSQSKIILLQGVKNPVADVTDGIFDRHEQGGTALFTGVRQRDTESTTGISMDQWLSQRIDGTTALKKPLVMGVWRGFAGGAFHTRTWYHRSWLASGEPAAPLVKPLSIFQSLFGEVGVSAKDRYRALKMRNSVLDTVVGQMKSLTGDRSQLPASHRILLTDHLEKIRFIEQQALEIEKEFPVNCRPFSLQAPAVELGQDGLLAYSEFERVFRAQIDLMVLAMECDITRTGSLMFCSAGEEYINPSISSLVTDHQSSHYYNDGERDIYIDYRRFHMQNLHYLMQRLGEVGLLDSTTIIAGSEFGESRGHVPHPMPHLIAGGGGKLQMGQTIDLEQKQTLCDVYSTVLTAIGHPVVFGEAEFNTGLITKMIKA